jgi:CelD/BcsL family acetyltransferase involved in cellulose biosynthesis
VNVRVCVIYRGGAVCGFLPYQFSSRLSAWTKTAEPIGGEMTDYVGLIANPELRITPDRLLRLARINYFGFSHLDESQLGFGLTGEQPRTGLRIRLARDTERPLEALLTERHKYRKDTERRARQLAAELGPIEFVLDVQQGRREALDNLIKQKRAQYQRTNVPDALANPWKPALLHKLSACQFSSCRSVLSTMSAGGHWIAMHYGIVGNGVLQYWLPVYNPAFSKYAPGRLLIHHVIGASRAAAIHTIDRGEGDTSSKRELANEEHRFYRGVWHNKSVASRVAQGFHSIKWRLGA